MSFTVKIKEEISNIKSTKSEIIAELSGYIRNNGIFQDNKVTLNTENKFLVDRISNFIQVITDINPQVEIIENLNFSKKELYQITIENNLDKMLKELGIYNEKNEYLPVVPTYIVGANEEIRAYLRGVFFASGSINDPKTSRYHLEFLIDDYDYSLFVCELLDYFNLNSKLIERNNGFMIYIKEAEKISDFLRIMKAYNAVLYFEDIKAYREHKNLVNRLNNCEQANVEKTINSALNQVSDIELIENKIGIDALDEKLQTVCVYRKKYKEASLSELSNIISMETNTKVTKSGLNHRMRKIKEIANNLRRK